MDDFLPKLFEQNTMKIVANNIKCVTVATDRVFFYFLFFCLFFLYVLMNM